MVFSMLEMILFLYIVFIFGLLVDCDQIALEQNSKSSHTKIHELFMKHYPGGYDMFLEAIRERADWNPLQLFEFTRNENQPEKWERFDALGPVIQCPSIILESFGKDDGEKRICGNLNTNECVVISVGSFNVWDFEIAIHEKYPNCEIHTLDCYNQGIIPDEIKSKTSFHSICLSIQDKIINNKEFLTWGSFARKIGLKSPPTAMKMDIEGFEWSVIPSIIKTNYLIPESFSFELHYLTNIEELLWMGRKRNNHEIGLFIEFLYNYGYILVDRHDNIHCSTCTELVIAKLLPNTRFLHHNTINLQSNLAMYHNNMHTSTSNSHNNTTIYKNILHTQPFPSYPI